MADSGPMGGAALEALATRPGNGGPGPGASTFRAPLGLQTRAATRAQ